MPKRQTTIPIESSEYARYWEKMFLYFQKALLPELLAEIEDAAEPDDPWQHGGWDK